MNPILLHSLQVTQTTYLLPLNPFYYTWRSLSTSYLHPFLGLPLRLVPSSSWVKIFLGILSSSILSRWPSQLILCSLIHFTIFSPLLNSSSSRFVRPRWPKYSWGMGKLFVRLILSYQVAAILNDATYHFATRKRHVFWDICLKNLLMPETPGLPQALTVKDYLT